MKILTVIGLLFLSGCVLKSRIFKTLEPVDEVMKLVSSLECNKFPPGQVYQCYQAKHAAVQAHNALLELGVKSK